MRLRFIRDDIRVHPKIPFDASRMVERDGGRFCRTDVEHETDAKTVVRHVRNLDAVPADAEADEVCKFIRKPKDMTRAMLGREAKARGIHPDDMDAFLNGEIEGYFPDGSFKPGPNWIGDEPDEED